MKIVTALSGEGEFTIKHVQALAKQLDEHAPFTSFACITNEKVPGVTCLPNHNKWPGWWIKFEAFAPEIKGPILWMDLDTIILGPLDDILAVRKLTLLRDFYRTGKPVPRGLNLQRRPGSPKPEGLGAGLMLLNEEDRKEPYEYFSKNPRPYMEQYRNQGDQPLLESYYLKHAQRWQDVVPGQIVSWKVDCCGANEFQKPAIPVDARVICFHGTPRPWSVDQFKDLYV
jgi:hypothetical protein